MDNKLNLGSIQIPINAATKTFAILAKRGAGKTYAAAVLAEEFFKNNIPFAIFDPIDVWWGLRLNKNGKDKGLPIVVFGLEHADIKLDRDMGRRIAQAIVKDNVSCVISTFGMPKVAQRFLIAEFAEEILNINNTQRHIFIEEAHEFVPQRVFGGLGKTFNNVSNLVVMGRNRGIGVTLINQRAATINKDVLTQVDAIVALRSVGPQDKKALADYASFHGVEDDPKFNQFINSLPSLPTGEGWIWSPEFLGKFERIKIRKRETFHPDRERGIGEKFVIPQLDQIDVQVFIEKFSQVKEKKSLPEKLAGLSKFQEELKPKESPELISFKNEYESKLLQKDIEIRKKEEVIEAVRRIVGVGSPTGIQTNYTGSNLDMWLKRLGNGGAGRILKFLAEKGGLKFTRSQIGLMVGLSSKSGSFSTYMATLKRNNLILEEGGSSKVNPDL